MTTPLTVLQAQTSVAGYNLLNGFLICPGDSIMGHSVLWHMTTVRASKGTPIYGVTFVEPSRD